MPQCPKLSFELLENRRLLSASAASLADQIVAVPQLTLRPAAQNSAPAPSANGDPSVDGYSPQQIQHAYGFDQITLSNGIKGDGSGQTIAIVDAYNDPNLASDLHTFDQQFSLQDPKLAVVSQTGSASSLPKTDAGWAGEIALDVEWAHAIAPGANIMLVEAKTATLGDLMSAVDYARNASGVSVVSMSWGSNEFSLETSFDSHLTTPAGHQGVTFVASAGDSGSWSGAAWPSVAPGVVSVGGTTLYTSDPSGTYLGETGWNGSGGGISSYESEPAYQSNTQITGARTAPDVAFNANPYTGFAIYDSLPYQGMSGWQVAGGTSAGAPQWAALVAIADQGRAANGAGTLDGATGTLPALYSTYGSSGTYMSDIHDVRMGRSSFFIGARPGYDLVTGLGSPQANQVVQLLIGSNSGNAASQRVSAGAPAARRNHAQPLELVVAGAASASPAPATGSPFSNQRIGNATSAGDVLAGSSQQTRIASVAVASSSEAIALSAAGPQSAFMQRTPHGHSTSFLPSRSSDQGSQPMLPHHHLATQSFDQQASELAKLPVQTFDAATVGAILDHIDSSHPWKQWSAVAAAGVLIGAWAAQRNKKIAADVRAALARRFRG